MSYSDYWNQVYQPPSSNLGRGGNIFPNAPSFSGQQMSFGDFQQKPQLDKAQFMLGGGQVSKPQRPNFNASNALGAMFGGRIPEGVQEWLSSLGENAPGDAGALMRALREQFPNIQLPGWGRPGIGPGNPGGGPPRRNFPRPGLPIPGMGSGAPITRRVGRSTEGGQYMPGDGTGGVVTTRPGFTPGTIGNVPKPFMPSLF